MPRANDAALCYCGHTASAHVPIDRGTHEGRGPCTELIHQPNGPTVPCPCTDFRRSANQSPLARPAGPRHAGGQSA